ncbi:hypothetical protein SPHINGO391_470120 [Sphingomonas aurantiaca]|uniref:Uncharacterized protein n=1 Tax=Sphingomonas aurantiaca TaxID=185949 RepID=A0A5E7ZNU4_9SPHN|nr:hypothetical protein SPHINGO391_470120 [Sphingomonas aurantiaca]
MSVVATAKVAARVAVLTAAIVRTVVPVVTAKRELNNHGTSILPPPQELPVLRQRRSPD